MEKEDTISVQWAQEDVETSYSLLNNNNNNNNNNKSEELLDQLSEYQLLEKNSVPLS